MALSDKISALHQELVQRQDAQEARSLLQSFRSEVKAVNARLQKIADSGSFTTLDVDVKSALIATWDICKSAETSLDTGDVKELLDWSVANGD